MITIAGGNLSAIDPNQYGHSPLRGILLVDVADDYLHPQGYLDIATKAAPANKGRKLANLMSPPVRTETDERVNPFEDLYAKSADVVGEEQIQSTRVEISTSIASLTLENMKLLRPDFVFSEVYGPDGAFATLIVGAGTAAYTVTADARGPGGNSIRIRHVNPGANNAALAVSVSGNDITVSLATDGVGALASTGAQIVAAINAHAGASALVNASTSDGSGVAAAMALTNLAGGTNGTVVGIRMKRTLVLNISDYLKNIVLAASTSTHTIGYAFILRKAINVNDDVELSFNDDMSAFGVDVTWRAHSDASSADPVTGAILPNVETHNYTETALPV